MLKAIIVEDMPEAVQLLISDIQTYCKEIQIIGTASSVVNAAKLLRQEIPDIIFLDISLSDGTGFDLLEIFPDLKANIIFTTAHEEFALRAFRYSATNYLLKPIDAELLQKAIEKVKNRKYSMTPSIEILKETINHPNTLPSRISLSTSEKIHIVTIADIIRCESDGNNTWFFLHSGEKVYVTKTLKYFEDILTQHHFIRVHQSHLVNFNYLLEFSKRDGGFLRLKNGHEIPVSVRKKAEVLLMLDKLG